jgi:hypothetical protein
MLTKSLLQFPPTLIISFQANALNARDSTNLHNVHQFALLTAAFPMKPMQKQLMNWWQRKIYCTPERDIAILGDPDIAVVSN